MKKEENSPQRISFLLVFFPWFPEQNEKKTDFEEGRGLDFSGGNTYYLGIFGGN